MNFKSLQIPSRPNHSRTRNRFQTIAKKEQKKLEFICDPNDSKDQINLWRQQRPDDRMVSLGFRPEKYSDAVQVKLRRKQLPEHMMLLEY
jgi:hypothetical protein